MSWVLQLWKWCNMFTWKHSGYKLKGHVLEYQFCSQSSMCLINTCLMTCHDSWPHISADRWGTFSFSPWAFQSCFFHWCFFSLCSCAFTLLSSNNTLWTRRIKTLLPRHVCWVEYPGLGSANFIYGCDTKEQYLTSPVTLECLGCIYSRQTEFHWIQFECTHWGD